MGFLSLKLKVDSINLPGSLDPGTETECQPETETESLKLSLQEKLKLKLKVYKSASLKLKLSLHPWILAGFLSLKLKVDATFRAPFRPFFVFPFAATFHL